MPTVTFAKPWPACRICGSTKYVTTAANPHSPRLGLCRSCGLAASEILKLVEAMGEPRLHQVVEWAIAVNAGQSSLDIPFVNAV